MWKAIDALRLEASPVSAKMAQESVGVPPQKRTKSSAVQMKLRLESFFVHVTHPRHKNHGTVSQRSGPHYSALNPSKQVSAAYMVCK